MNLTTEELLRIFANKNLTTEELLRMLAERAIQLDREQLIFLLGCSVPHGICI